MFFYVFGAVALAMSTSLDAFTASFAYGCKKIEIPPKSAFIINAICTGAIGLSFLLGMTLARFIPEWVAIGLSFAILFIIGIIKLLDSITKSIIRKHANISKEIKLSLFNFKLILHLYADPIVDDIAIRISSREAMVLAVSLSLDGFAVGFGAALSGLNGLVVVLFSFITNGLSIWLGGKLGNKAARNLRFNISWLAGAVLIVLAFAQFI